MIEKGKTRIEDAFISKTVKAESSGETIAAFMLKINGVSMSDEQFRDLLGILDRAATEAKTVMH